MNTYELDGNWKLIVPTIQTNHMKNIKKNAPRDEERVQRSIRVRSLIMYGHQSTTKYSPDTPSM